MEDPVPEKPVPLSTPLSEPYWQAARRGSLVLQRCTACGKYRHYPQPLCAICHSPGAEWIDVARRGTIYSWTITHHAFHPAFARDLPYTLATVDLEVGVRVLGRYEGARRLELGLPVRLRFENDAHRTPTLLVEPA